MPTGANAGMGRVSCGRVRETSGLMPTGRIRGQTDLSTRPKGGALGQVRSVPAFAHAAGLGADSSVAAFAHASVVIPNWNGRDLLEKYLPSVIEAMGGNEILVVD